MSFVQSSIFSNKNEKSVMEHYQDLASGETTMLTLANGKVKQSEDKEIRTQLDLTEQLEEVILKIHNKLSTTFGSIVFAYITHDGLSSVSSSVNWTAKGLTADMPLASLRLNLVDSTKNTVNIVTDGQIAIVDLNDKEKVDAIIDDLSSPVELYEDYSAITSSAVGLLNNHYKEMVITHNNGITTLANDTHVLDETNCEYPQAVTVIDTLMNDAVAKAIYKSGKLYIASISTNSTFPANSVVETNNQYGHVYFNAPRNGYVNLVTDDAESYLIHLIDGDICGIFNQEVNTLVNNSHEVYFEDDIMKKIYDLCVYAKTKSSSALDVNWLEHQGQEFPVPLTNNFAVALRFVRNSKKFNESIYLTGASLIHPTNANALTCASHVITPAIYVTAKGKESINLVEDCFMELTENGELDLRSIINWIDVEDELIKLNSTDNTYKIPTTINGFWEHALAQLCANMRLGQTIKIDKVNVNRIGRFELKFSTI